MFGRPSVVKFQCLLLPGIWLGCSLVCLIAVGCQSSSVCSKLATAPCDTAANITCQCFELYSIGGGIAGGSYDARSKGEFGAVVVRSDSVMNFYDGDTLKWSSAFSPRMLEEETYRKYYRASIVMDNRSLDGVWSFRGSDTLDWWFPGTVDGPSRRYIKK